MFKRKQEEGPAPGPISFRLGELAPAVQRRAAADESLATVVRRDLARYYDLLCNTELPDFTVEEADALTILLYGYSDLIALLSTVVTENAEGIQRRLEEVGADDVLRPRVPDLARFFEKIAGMARTQQLATLDAVERYWVAWERHWAPPPRDQLPLFSDPVNETELTLLQGVGLVHPVYAHRYLKGQRQEPPVEPSKRKVLSDAEKKRAQR